MATSRQFRDLFDDCLRVLGSDHPGTRNALRNLAYWQDKLDVDV